MTAPQLLALAALLIIGTGAIFVFEIPDTPADAMHQAEGVSVPSDTYLFSCPSADGTSRTTCTLALAITQNDFESSMGTNTIRCQSRVTDCSDFVTPSDPFVAKIAETLLNLTPDAADYIRATAALWFVQTAIGYETDPDLFGQREFVAYPVETLYLHRGDCEDQAILLASIMKAMGLDCVLLDFPGHVAVGVCVGSGHGTTYTLDGKVYSYCEATHETATLIGSGAPSGEPRIVELGSRDSAKWALNGFIAGYRSLIQRITTI